MGVPPGLMGAKNNNRETRGSQLLKSGGYTQKSRVLIDERYRDFQQLSVLVKQ
jgi:hypothetical protein